MKKYETIVLGGGCFWCTEAIFQQLKGIISIEPGFAGGKTPNPSYYDVIEGTTGHAESIKIEFDPTIITTHDLLDIFFHSHNPTTLNRQDYDTGTEYRSIILYTTNDQQKIAEKIKKNIDKSGEYKYQIITEIKPLDNFYPADEYHKNFYNKNSNSPYCQIIISPKIQKLREKYIDKLKI